MKPKDNNKTRSYLKPGQVWRINNEKSKSIKFVDGAMPTKEKGRCLLVIGKSSLTENAWKVRLFQYTYPLGELQEEKHMRYFLDNSIHTDRIFEDEIMKSCDFVKELA